jgi:tetratricopeptide (TPR) repeat protein
MAVKRYPAGGYWNNLALDYRVLGRHDDALNAYRDAVSWKRGGLPAYVGLAVTYMALDRRRDAKVTLDVAAPSEDKPRNVRRLLYLLGFLNGDKDMMADQAAWFDDHPDVPMEQIRTGELAFSGRFRQFREVRYRWLVAAVQEGRGELAANTLAHWTGIDAMVGLTSQVDSDVQRVLETPGADVDTRMNAAWALAYAGRAAAAEEMASDISRDYPEATRWHNLTLPMIRANIALQRGNLEAALDAMRPAARLGLALPLGLYSHYTRGQVLLALGRGPDAAAEFRKILDHPGIIPVEVVHPLARLGLARASALAGDDVAARKHYEDFLTLWKDADPDVPVLQQAKVEYQRLK